MKKNKLSSVLRAAEEKAIVLGERLTEAAHVISEREQDVRLFSTKNHEMESLLREKDAEISALRKESADLKGNIAGLKNDLDELISKLSASEQEKSAIEKDYKEQKQKWKRSGQSTKNLRRIWKS